MVGNVIDSEVSSGQDDARGIKKGSGKEQSEHLISKIFPPPGNIGLGLSLKRWANATRHKQNLERKLPNNKPSFEVL